MENTRYEVIAGELYITPPPMTLHQAALQGLLMPMFGWADEEHGLGVLFSGPLDVLFGEGDFIEPDGLFIRRDRTDIIKDHGVEGVPDLIIECVTLDTAERDRGLKRDRYAHFGVPEYWVLDPGARTVEIYRHTAPGYGPPDSVRDRWAWQPIAYGPVLELRLPEVLKRHDELKLRFERRGQFRTLP
jgi:Uma2 family endonuclease